MIRRWMKGFGREIHKSQNGFILIAALTLLSSLTLIGATAYLLSSTDIKIGGNFRTSKMVLQAAMAASERAREIIDKRVARTPLRSAELRPCWETAVE
jgi:Tfp pilus assembly protein PilX